MNYNSLTKSTTQINPNDGMTRNQFLILLEQNGITLDESRMAEVNHYWNLWVDSVNYGRKNTAAKPEFDDFITWMKKQ